MFNLGILILVTIAFLLFGYSITHADIFAPFCVFCEMFLIAEFMCLFFANMYKLELHFSILIGQMFVSMKKNILENIFL